MRYFITLMLSVILLVPASGQGQLEKIMIDSMATGLGKIIPDLCDVQFLDRESGFIIVDMEVGSAPARVLYITEDGGKTWNLIYEDLPGGLSSVHFVNESKGFISHSEGLLSSWNGGINWVDNPTFGEVYDVFFLNDSIGWAGGMNVIYNTKDGGEKWFETYTYTGAYRPFYSIYFIDEESGWAVGNNGTITKYSLKDGWENQFFLVYRPLNKVFFVDQEYGWISGGYPKSESLRPIFMRTVDGGVNWDIFTELNYLINDFYFENRDHGFAVGKESQESGVILETQNGGQEWNIVERCSSGLNSLSYSDGMIWAVGDEGLVLKYDPTATGISEDNRINSGNKHLLQNYPNPFHSNTTITYQLTASSNVELSIYDLSGRKVATLVNEIQQPDKYEVEWNAEGMNPGIYFYQLKTGQGRKVMKISIVR